jgi:hypothetical protein
MSQIDDVMAKADGVEEHNKKLIQILKDPRILEIIDKELDKKIAGEHNARKTIFLISCGRLVENRTEKGAYNLMVNSESSSGKDYVVRNTLTIWKEEAIESRKRISPTALTYMHNAKFEPEWTWNGKLLYLEDVSNSILNSDVFKVMSSGGEGKSTIVVKNKAYDYVCQGQPVIIITIASPNPNTELLRRFPILSLDESVEQTKEVMRKQARIASIGKTIDYDPELKEALKCLMKVKVKVPFADELTEKFPSNNLIMRTCFPRFLDYIKSSVALHQWQRDKDDEGYYLAIGQDYDIARDMILNTVSNQSFIPLTKTQKRILDVIKALPNDPYVNPEGYSVSELEVHINFVCQKTLYNQLDKLTEYGFLGKNKTIRNNREVMVYQYIGFDNIDIPKWEDIYTDNNVTNNTTTTNITNVTTFTNTTDSNPDCSGCN